ncbi:hypothetical protein RhiirC2_797418 [Rhizophagus irregularis]|uniref:Uncharacterized protein n=1 Tax=Rhizophagus irregularis TaxID=588596 RepID=A0A2N1M815_9GLOM|nr:hypothetical protein RhiirC2_797418 [Rhizophagus irregularis]
MREIMIPMNPMQVEELTRLLKTVTKGKQKPKYVQKYGIPGSSKSVRSRLSPSPSPSSSSSSSLTSFSSSSKSAPSLNSASSSNLSSFLHYEEMNRDQRNALRVPPEESETDEDNPNKCKIVIWNLKWRSSSLIEKYSENKCSPPEEADENQDPLEEDDQAEEDENQEVVDKNQEEVDENQEDEEEDQNKNKRGVNVVSSEYDSISSE